MTLRPKCEVSQPGKVKLGALGCGGLLLLFGLFGWLCGKKDEDKPFGVSQAQIQEGLERLGARCFANKDTEPPHGGYIDCRLGDGRLSWLLRGPSDNLTSITLIGLPPIQDSLAAMAITQTLTLAAPEWEPPALYADDLSHLLASGGFKQYEVSKFITAQLRKDAREGDVWLQLKASTAVEVGYVRAPTPRPYAPKRNPQVAPREEAATASAELAPAAPEPTQSPVTSVTAENQGAPTEEETQAQEASPVRPDVLQESQATEGDGGGSEVASENISGSAALGEESSRGETETSDTGEKVGNLLQLARALLGLGRHVEAKTAANEALALDASNAEAKELLRKAQEAEAVANAEEEQERKDAARAPAAREEAVRQPELAPEQPLEEEMLAPQAKFGPPQARRALEEMLGCSGVMQLSEVPVPIRRSLISVGRQTVGGKFVNTPEGERVGIIRADAVTFGTQTAPVIMVFGAESCSTFMKTPTTAILTPDFVLLVADAPSGLPGSYLIEAAFAGSGKPTMFLVK